MEKFKLSGEVILRIIEIVQEAFLTGVDSSDLFRMMELQVKESDSSVVVLSEEYKKQVKSMNARIVENLEEMKKNRSKNEST